MELMMVKFVEFCRICCRRGLEENSLVLWLLGMPCDACPIAVDPIASIVDTSQDEGHPH